VDGIHDLGGKHGYGDVDHEVSGTVFHARWEAAVFAMVNAGARAGAWHNFDRFRHAVERIDPVAYLAHGYYGRWLGGLETLLVEAGLVTTAEIEQRLKRVSQSPPVSFNEHVAARPKAQPDPMGPLPQMAGSQRAIPVPSEFKVGDRVTTATEVQDHHTRLPAYARGKSGRIAGVHGGWVYPDDNAHGRGENPCYLYTVTFDGLELWPGGDPLLTVSLDLFEPYLKHVTCPANDAQDAQESK